MGIKLSDTKRQYPSGMPQLLGLQYDFTGMLRDRLTASKGAIRVGANRENYLLVCRPFVSTFTHVSIIDRDYAIFNLLTVVIADVRLFNKFTENAVLAP